MSMCVCETGGARKGETLFQILHHTKIVMGLQYELEMLVKYIHMERALVPVLSLSTHTHTHTHTPLQ
jgi:hypothetical protein